MLKAGGLVIGNYFSICGRYSLRKMVVHSCSVQFERLADCVFMLEFFFGFRLFNGIRCHLSKIKNV